MKKNAFMSLLIGAGFLISATAAVAGPPPWAGPPSWAGPGKKADRVERHYHYYDGHRYRRPVKEVHHYHFDGDWYHDAYVGMRLPRDFHRHGYRLPSHGRIRHLQSGITEPIIADQVIRILDATQTIVNVSR